MKMWTRFINEDDMSSQKNHPTNRPRRNHVVRSSMKACHSSDGSRGRVTEFTRSRLKPTGTGQSDHDVLFPLNSFKKGQNIERMNGTLRRPHVSDRGLYIYASACEWIRRCSRGQFRPRRRHGRCVLAAEWQCFDCANAMRSDVVFLTLLLPLLVQSYVLNATKEGRKGLIFLTAGIMRSSRPRGDDLKSLSWCSLCCFLGSAPALKGFSFWAIIVVLVVYKWCGVLRQCVLCEVELVVDGSDGLWC